ncbi:hypothetical protein evm_003522 [Chilo suppressalis]|nr:hypothetical protein evm_003522 [Chilo suppressalis]
MAPGTPSSKVWKQIKRFRRASDRPNPTSNNPAEWMDTFADKLAPPFVPPIDCLPLCPYLVLHSSHPMDKPFNFNELQTALCGLKDSSPGVDGIPYSFLVNSTEKIKHYFLKVVNIFFEQGIIPESWNKQIVIPLLKSGKDPRDSNSYRPIALSSTLFKIMEHMIRNRLEWLLESQNLLAKSQYGFRKGSSTLVNLSILTTDIRIAFKKKEYVVGLFLDIASAYDNVLLPVLRHKLQQLSVPVKLTRFILNAISCRTIEIRYQGISLPPRMLWKGLPQGSPLSPLLYNVYTYDLEKTVDSFCQVLQYADDVALYTRCKSIPEASTRLNLAMSYLSDWLTDHGLTLSISKSSCTVFTKKRTMPSPNIFFESTPIPLCDQVKFLGVTLDSRLSGCPHFENVIKKCEKSVNILRALSGVWWGSHPYTQKLLYNAIVRSHLDYGTFLLDPCNKLPLDKISKIQSKCLRIILGAMKSSPINALQVESVDPPLYLRRQYLSDRFILKILPFSSHPLMRKLKTLSQLCLSQPNSSNNIPCILHSYNKFNSTSIPIEQFPCQPLFMNSFDSLTFSPPVILNFGAEKDSPTAVQTFFNNLSTHWQNWTPLYTDAARLHDKGSIGAAVWFPAHKIILSLKLPPLASVFTGEAIAILEAVLFIESHSLNNSLIFTDSQSCLQAINSNQFRSKSKFPIVLKIREALLRCHLKGTNVALAWIPGHNGIPGNETADTCAKHAISSGLPKYSRVFYQGLYSVTRELLFKSWETHWLQTKNRVGKYYFDIQQNIPSKPWFFKVKNLNKKVVSTICRLRIGHATTPVHLVRLKIRDSPTCDCGTEDGTVDHLFFNCPKLNISLYDILPPTIPRPISMKVLLCLCDYPTLKLLAKFISLNKLRL